ncbi:MAG TPA: hypothetical protein VMF31_00060 [Solirubrobacterales bacterium]|nr:hypothetical protein [Solirubrobacterales bacterium]
MYARIVRFTDVTSETVQKVKAQVEESDGPPPGVDAKAMKLMFDSEQGTSVFVAFFETEEAMKDADPVFRNMDTSDTPGTRASIDLCEVAISREVD